MLKFKIIKKDEYTNYVLSDKDGNNYKVNINFMNMDKPNEGSIIYIPKEVINENVSLNYGVVDINSKIKKEELIVLINNEQKIYLQRFYG